MRDGCLPWRLLLLPHRGNVLAEVTYLNSRAREYLVGVAFSVPLWEARCADLSLSAADLAHVKMRSIRDFAVLGRSFNVTKKHGADRKGVTQLQDLGVSLSRLLFLMDFL